MSDAAVRRPPTEDPRMWDAFVGIGLGVLAIVACFAAAPLPIALGVGSVVVLAAAYVGLARRAMLHDVPSTAFQVLAVLAAGVAAWAYGPMGAVQALVAPLLWATSGPGIRRAVVANVGLFGAVFAAFALEGAAVWLLATTQALSFAFSMVIGLWISGLARANEERAHLIAALERAQASVARLSGEQATAAERARIARDLHDTIAQDLAAIAMLAQRGTPDAAVLAAIEETAQRSLAEVRGLVAASAGVGLDDGLAVALQRLGARFEAETSIPVAVDAAAVDLPVDAEVALLRTAQEALANVRKHAEAAGVRLSLAAEGPDAVLVVADDGRGFDRATVTRGLGLVGLDERVSLAGGTLEIRSSAAGTTVTARIAGAEAAP